MSSISVVIPAYNEDKNIGRCLESVLKQPKDSLLEIVVVDNNSTDSTSVVASSYPEVKVVAEPRKGVAFARTRGAEEAQGEIVAFLDADTHVPQGWADNVVRLFSDKKVVAASGPAYYDDISGLQKMLVFVYWFMAAYLIYPVIGYMAIFANFAVRKDVLKSIGGIDTSVEFYGDDTNLARRFSKAGKMRFDRKFYVYTTGRRLKGEGVLLTGYRYAANFFSEVILHRPVTKGYTEIR